MPRGMPGLSNSRRIEVFLIFFRVQEILSLWYGDCLLHRELGASGQTGGRLEGEGQMKKMLDYPGEHRQTDVGYFPGSKTAFGWVLLLFGEECEQKDDCHDNDDRFSRKRYP